MSVSKIEKNCAYHDDVTKATLCVSDIRDNIVYFFSVKNDGFRGYVSSIQHDDALNRFSLLGAYSLKSIKK